MISRPMTVGSLFAGIGGFDLGFERAGFKIVWQVEIDEYCRRVLERHFPRAERFADIRDCGAHNLRRVDVISGGFPCQPTSLAGKRLGVRDERWLWPECLRIIRALRPRYAVLENPPGLLTLGIGDVLGALAACGYDAEWIPILAAELGAPHLRERIWFVAYPVRDRHSESPTAYTSAHHEEWHSKTHREIGRNVADSPKPSRQDVADANGQRLQKRDEQRSTATQRSRVFSRSELVGACTASGRQQWEIEPNVGRVAHGVPCRVDRLRGLGNAVVPQIAQWIAERIKATQEGVSRD